MKDYSPKIIAALLLASSIFLPGGMPATVFAEPLFFVSSQDYKNVLVVRVKSADTIVLESGERISLIGIKAPDAPKKRIRTERDQYNIVIEKEVKPTSTIEERAFAYVKKLLEGKRVTLEFDSQKRGDQNSTLAYVFLEDDTLVNAEILRNGFADLQIRPPNIKYAELLREAYREAHREKRGLQGQ